MLQSGQVWTLSLNQVMSNSDSFLPSPSYGTCKNRRMQSLVHKNKVQLSLIRYRKHILVYTSRNQSRRKKYYSKTLTLFKSSCVYLMIKTSNTHSLNQNLQNQYIMWSAGSQCLWRMCIDYGVRKWYAKKDSSLKLHKRQPAIYKCYISSIFQVPRQQNLEWALKLLSKPIQVIS